MGVSERWYAIFESGVSDRRFSAEFIERVAEVLRLGSDDRLKFYRMALPPVDAIAERIECRLNVAELDRLTKVRDLARRLREEQRFEDAVAHAAGTLQALVAADCVTVASIGYPGEAATGLAFGPHSDFWMSDAHRVAVAVHASLGPQEVSMCEHAPAIAHPADLGQVTITFKRLRPPGTVYSCAMATGEYARLNGNLRAASALVVPVYRRGRYRGAIQACWLEPRQAQPYEVKAIQTVLAILNLAV